MKIKKSIIIVFLLISIIPLVIFGTFSIYEMNKKINSMTECNLMAITQNQIVNIQNFAKDRKSEMEKIAHYDLTIDTVKGLDNDSQVSEDRAYLDNLLREQKNYGMYVASISVLNKDFRVVGSSEYYEAREFSELKDIDEKYHNGSFIMGDVYERMTDNGKKKLVPAYIGIYENDELIGYIAEELDTEYFDELRLNMDSLADGTFYLLDGNSQIITAGNTKEKSSIQQFVTNNSEREDFQNKWNAIDHNANPSGQIKYKYRNNEYVTYYSNLDNSDWMIRVTENLSSQKEDVISFSLFIGLMLATIILGAIVMQNFFAQKITLPISKAVQIFDYIKQTGDYSVRFEVNQKNEFGKIAESINSLLEYIEKEKLKEKAIKNKLIQQAESDPLTGIKNKKAIENTILDMVQTAINNETQITLGFLDVDEFRDFNTKYGHQNGDIVIQFVAKTLSENLHGEVGRVGGDEFMFCYVGSKDISDIKQSMNELLDKLRAGCKSNDGSSCLHVPCSIGIVTTKGTKIDYIDLVRKADKAMYNAKEAGRNTFVIEEME